MRSTHPSVPALVACAAALALLPAAAGASAVRTIPLQAPAFGVATDGAGHVHVIESGTQTDAIFNADGTLAERVALPGTPGSAENAVSAADGSVWVAIDTTDSTGGLARVGTDGTVTPVPTTTLTSCGPSGLVAAGNAIAFTSFAVDSGGTHCPNGGVGVVNGATPSMLSTTEDGGYDIAYADGALFVPDYAADEIHRLNPDGTIAARIPLPGGSGPDQLVAGPDGDVYVTLYDAGGVARFTPRASGPGSAEILGYGLAETGGIAVGPHDEVDVADHGGASVQAFDPATRTTRAIDLPTGFAPRELAKSGTDLWVTDDTAARVAIVTDDAPAGVSILGASAIGASVGVDPRGNDTRISVTATKAGQTMTSVPSTVSANATGARAPATFRPPLTPGDWTLVAHASNRRGASDSAPFALHVPGATTPVNPGPGPGGPVPIHAPVPKPRAPRFADLVTVAPTARCVPGRHLLLLRLRRQPGERTIAWVTVRLGRHKAHKYLARRLKHGLQLRNLPGHGALKLTVTVRLANGKTYKKTLTYKACKAKHR